MSDEAHSDVMRAGPWKPLDPETAAQVLAVKSIGEALFLTLEKLPPSREVSIAKTKVEETVMWAVKGLTKP